MPVFKWTTTRRPRRSGKKEGETLRAYQITHNATAVLVVANRRRFLLLLIPCATLAPLGRSMWHSEGFPQE